MDESGKKNYNIVEGFNLIAPAYDLANDAMTFGLHRSWRRKLCRSAARAAPRGGRVLDLATGTGDVLFELAELRPDLELIGLDPSEGMLREARRKHMHLKRNQLKKLTFEQGDGRQLPYPDNSFDVVTISWGIRNIRPFMDGLKEIRRVLRPGGQLFVLESGQPEWRLVRLFYRYYARVLPYIGERLSRYRPAYQYYTASVDSFPSGSDFVARLHEAQFAQPSYQALVGGIVYLYAAAKG
jgi:demethylmenaquinone methyltransferase/2-methoxy-6-polyprenyl-1,4-benzoquinol methylase